MDEKSKLNKIIEAVSRYSTNKEFPICESSLLVEELGYDSLGFIQLMVDLEEKFEVQFISEEFVFENFSTPKKILKRIVNNG